MSAVIDDADFDLVKGYDWFLHQSKNTIYAYANIRDEDGKWQVISMHRLILGLKRGDKRKGDHINGDGLNNQRSNLRATTNQDNCRNRKGSHLRALLTRGLEAK